MDKSLSCVQTVRWQTDIMYVSNVSTVHWWAQDVPISHQRVLPIIMDIITNFFTFEEHCANQNRQHCCDICYNVPKRTWENVFIFEPGSFVFLHIVPKGTQNHTRTSQQEKDMR